MFVADVDQFELILTLVITPDNQICRFYQILCEWENQDYLAHFDDGVGIGNHTAGFITGNLHEEIHNIIACCTEKNCTDNGSCQVEQHVHHGSSFGIFFAAHTCQSGRHGTSDVTSQHHKETNRQFHQSFTGKQHDDTNRC